MSISTTTCRQWIAAAIVAALAAALLLPTLQPAMESTCGIGRAPEAGHPATFELPPLKRTLQATSDLACGSAPTDSAGYECLARAKFRTVIRVDGLPPDAELAQRSGLKVVHLPVHFSNLEHDILPILQAQRQLPGPHYICCMYGSPRAPAATALSLRALHGRSLDEAREFLILAGVDDANPGLLASLTDFVPPPTIAERPAAEPFPVASRSTPTVEGMNALVVAWDPMRRWKAAGLKIDGPESTATLRGAAEKTAAAFDRLARLPQSADQGDEYLGLLQEGRTAATELSALLAQFPDDTATPPDEALRRNLLEQIDRVGSTCSRCHRVYRN